MDDKTLRNWFTETAPSPPDAKRRARPLSARELLAKLEGDEREALRAAMAARDLATVRRLLEKHADDATLNVESNRSCLEPPSPTMKPRGWSGPARPPRGGGAAA